MSLMGETILSNRAEITIESKRDGQKYRKKINIPGVSDIYKLIQFIPSTKQSVGTPTKISIDLR